MSFRTESSMKIACKYHPGQPAYFSCPRCRIHFCKSCSLIRDKGGFGAGERTHLCPGCNLPAEWLGISNLVEPFWKRLHHFFVYPLSLHPLLLAVLLAAAGAAAGDAGLVAGLVLVLVWAVRVKYSYEAMKATARGDLRPPRLSSGLIFEDFFQVFKQYLLGGVLVVAHFLVLAQLGPLGMLALLAGTVIFLPSMLILLVSTNSVLTAVNPMLFVPMVFRIGWAYLLMCFFLLLLMLAPGALGYYVLNFTPGSLQPLLLSCIETYYSIIFYHLMGYVLLQYSEDIGYEVDPADFHSGEAKAADPVSEEDRLMAGLAPLIQEGRLDAAVEQVESAVRAGRVKADAIRERHYKMVKAANRPEKLLEAGRGYIEQLLREGKTARAAQIYGDCAEADGAFSMDPASMLTLGEWLQENGRPADAVNAYQRLVKAHPESALVPEAYFKAAQTLHTGLRHTEKARKILSAILKRYPGGDVAPQAQRFLERLEGY